MSEAYDQKLRRLGLDVADQMGMQIREGVYVMQSGPCYESVTECRLLSLLGADVTGEEIIIRWVNTTSSGTWNIHFRVKQMVSRKLQTFDINVKIFAYNEYHL